MPSKDVIIPLKMKTKNGINLGAIMGNKATKGEIGIEIEVEGKSLPHQGSTPLPWVYHVDHSLRGEDNGEYVLHHPMNFDEVPAALKTLWGAFKTKKSKFDDSNRTSVHVHLNCQPFFLNRLTSFIALWIICEVPLTEWCGEHRVGNLFCLRMIDAPAAVRYIRDFIVTDGQSQIPEVLHYSGLNANALKKYGSIEIRTLRGCSDPTVILDWVEILQRLYNLSADYPDPRDVCTGLSSMGPIAFFENILGPKTKTVLSGIKMSQSTLSTAIYEGVRIAQDLCYCRDWDLYKPMEIKRDPFDRSLKQVAKKLLNANPFTYQAQADADLMEALNNMQGTVSVPGQIIFNPPAPAHTLDDEDDYPYPDDAENYP